MKFRLLRYSLGVAALTGSWLGVPLAIAAGPTAAVPVTGQVAFLDRELIASDGRRVRLSKLVAEHRRVIISFTYARCQKICPVSDLTMNIVETLLEGRSDKDVALITLTTEPLVDDQDVLARRAAEVGSGPRRLWLTGDITNAYPVLDGLGVEYGRGDDHDGFFLVLNRGAKRVLRTDIRQGQIPSAEDLLELADGL